ncbi:MAG: nuclear transport factor 2 family protein [Pseudomonadota bacterium]
MSLCQSHYGRLLLLFLTLGFVAGETLASEQIAAVRQIIEAVNSKNVEQYVDVFADDAIVQLYRGPVRVNGKTDLLENRGRHFERFPEAASEIQHVVEIDNIVVLHDRVWLHGRDGAFADIVELFEFRNGLIVRVEVIQQRGLLSQPQSE